MKSLICKEILGTRTYSGTQIFSFTGSDVPEGTKSILFTVDDNIGTAYTVDVGYTYPIAFKPDSKNHFYLHRIWSNEINQIGGNSDQNNFSLSFARVSGNFSNVTLVYLR
jgi:hypothetical protein